MNLELGSSRCPRTKLIGHRVQTVHTVVQDVPSFPRIPFHHLRSTPLKIRRPSSLACLLACLLLSGAFHSADHAGRRFLTTAVPNFPRRSPGLLVISAFSPWPLDWKQAAPSSRPLLVQTISDTSRGRYLSAFAS